MRVLILVALALAGFAVVPVLFGEYGIFLGAEILIFILFALAFNLMLGHGGLVSFGHAAYFAIAAYGLAILLTTYSWPLGLAFPAAVLMSTAVAVLVGYFCVRLTAIYFAMLTLAFSQLVWAIAFKADFTGGDEGFVGVAIPAWLTQPVAFYYVTFAVVVLCSAILWVIVHSAFGRILRATRENPQRAEFLGVPVRRVRLVTFVLSGTFTGVAGALFTLLNRAVFVEFAWWTKSAEVLIMSILGGVGSFFGPALGAAALILLDRQITEVTEYWPTVLGIILLVVLFFLPDGLIGLFKKRKPDA
ncbi:branched-chain amino acid ABC transporter permease [Marivita sp. S0852]|uniref:branched-chain amino acid ABC transporter permease n=1 Tax=Marivita sp. S0852 TaxID=3373893 RepID=UPI003982870E